MTDTFPTLSLEDLNRNRLKNEVVRLSITGEPIPLKLIEELREAFPEEYAKVCNKK